METIFDFSSPIPFQNQEPLTPPMMSPQPIFSYDFPNKLQYATNNQMPGIPINQDLYSMQQTSTEAYFNDDIQTMHDITETLNANMTFSDSKFQFKLPDGLLTPPLTPNEIEETQTNKKEESFEFNIDEYIKPIIPDQYDDETTTNEIEMLALSSDNFLSINFSDNVTSSCQYKDSNIIQEVLPEKKNKRKITKEDKKLNQIKWSRSSVAHNTLERKRRTHMKTLFSSLRASIPAILENEKSPKIMILTQAIRHINRIKLAEQQLIADKELERQRNFILKQKLVELTSKRN